jgi:ribosomal-protein-alanine N-acetyltransferase
VSEVQLRHLTTLDLPALAALHARCFPATPWTQNALALLLAQPGSAGFLAEREGKLFGFLLLRRAADEAEVLSLGVDPAMRRQGLARRLLAAGETWLGHGTAQLFLEVAERNLPALALYRGLGFRPVGRREKYYADGGDALVLRRKVSGPAVPPPDNL